MKSKPPSVFTHSPTNSCRVLRLLMGFIACVIVGRAQCNTGDAVFWGSSGDGIRLDSNTVKTYGTTWVSGNYGTLWVPWEETWQELNGSIITSGASYNNNPGQTAVGYWTSNLNINGPGAYRDHSYHWAVSQTCSFVSPYYLGYTNGNAISIQRPTISGVSAFWWLGSGILSDHGYYAQAAWTANPNGASVTPTWSVSTVGGGGNVNLSCTTCSGTTATSTAPSNGCVFDVTVKVNYGGFVSTPFNVAIIRPSHLALLGGYPINSVWGSQGYNSSYEWQLQDTCNNPSAGLDANEVFGTDVDDYFQSTGIHSTWLNQAIATATYNSDATVYDTIGASNQTTPPARTPQRPLTSVKVFHHPWTLFVGTQTFGSGVAVRSDTQQWYQDHGVHQ